MVFTEIARKQILFYENPDEKILFHLFFPHYGAYSRTFKKYFEKTAPRAVMRGGKKRILDNFHAREPIIFLILSISFSGECHQSVLHTL